ncbi:MAG TPA: slipin family protein, partial [Mycobacteriales bacterium]|nr:slipin family protein [Mycobacteriales bacterium]
ATNPSALQLRLMQTMVEVAAEKNSTLIVPFPVELLRLAETMTDGAHRGGRFVTPEAMLSAHVPEQTSDRGVAYSGESVS